MRAKREINRIHTPTAVCLKILRLDDGKQHTTQPSKYEPRKGVPNKRGVQNQRTQPTTQTRDLLPGAEAHHK